MLRFGLVVLIAASVTACVQPTAPGSLRARDGVSETQGLLLLFSAEGVAAVAPAQGTRYTTPPALLTADGTRLLFTESVESGSRLVVADAGTGQAQAGRIVPETLRLAAVSASGRLAALAAPQVEGGDFWRPAGRYRTPFWVVDTQGGGEPRRYDLPGNLQPEAFSTDEQSLFVIDYLPPAAPDRYRVRRLDLQTGQVAPVQTRAKFLVEEEMRGQGRQQVLSPNRHVLYTLYLKEHDHLHARDRIEAGGPGQSRSESQAFVHVLNLAEQWAFCLDLPSPFGMGPAHSHTLAISPDGRSLFIADWSSGTVARADTESFRLETRPKGFRDHSQGGPAAARVGPNGHLYLSGGERLLSIDGRTLTPLASYDVGGRVTAIEVTPDGRQVFAALNDRIVVLDPTTRSVIAEHPAPAAASMRYVSGRSAFGPGFVFGRLVQGVATTTDFDSR